MTAMTDREELATALLRHQGLNDAGIGIYQARHLKRSNGRDYYGEALETADAILAAGFARNIGPISRPALEETLGQAEGWAKDGYSETSKSYWAGMRDTLRVVLGVTTQVPIMTPDEHVDAAAITILGAQQRATKKAGTR